jgi:hypothetical protein
VPMYVFIGNHRTIVHVGPSPTTPKPTKFHFKNLLRQRRSQKSEKNRKNRATDQKDTENGPPKGGGGGVQRTRLGDQKAVPGPPGSPRSPPDLPKQDFSEFCIDWGSFFVDFNRFGIDFLSICLQNWIDPVYKSCCFLFLNKKMASVPPWNLAAFREVSNAMLATSV